MNRTRAYASAKDWDLRNPDKREEIIERGRLRKYGLTIEQHQALFDGQNGLCRICKKPMLGRVHIDHCHVTRRIRGLLCHTCNVGLGHFRDDPALLRAAAEYVESEPLLDVLVPVRSTVNKPDDGRYKVTGAVRDEVKTMHSRGLSLGAIATKVGLSKSWVQMLTRGDG